MASIKAIVLASQSPFRLALLKAAGIRCQVRVAPIDEYAITATLPGAQARARAAAKALAVAELEPEALVIGADQVLSLGDETFDKAHSPEAAAERLRSLSGRSHYLHSAVALAYGEAGQAQVLRSLLVSVAMPMRELTSEEITAYVATAEWRGSVGCYQYENRGVHLFEAVQAEHSAIVGLPLAPLLQELRSLGINPLLQAEGPWVRGW